MSRDNELRSLARLKQSSDTDVAYYVQLGSFAAKAIWFIGGLIVIVTLWAARLEWKSAADGHNIDKLWIKVFPDKPIKDE